MNFILEGIGGFIYPLGLCSIIGVYVMIERIVALRSGKIVPKSVANALISGSVIIGNDDMNTSVGRIIFFFKNSNPDDEAIKAFAQLEMSRLERGVFLLDVVISAAPLLGLLGTVAGLVEVFATSDGSLPSPELISRGVGLALSTTIVGLSIAIPAILANSFITRRIDTLCAKINICVERLIDIKNASDKAE